MSSSIPTRRPRDTRERTLVNGGGSSAQTPTASAGASRPAARSPGGVKLKALRALETTVEHRPLGAEDDEGGAGHPWPPLLRALAGRSRGRCGDVAGEVGVGQRGDGGHVRRADADSEMRQDLAATVDGPDDVVDAQLVGVNEDRGARAGLRGDG